MSYQQGVVLIKKIAIRGQFVHEESLQFGISSVLSDQSQTAADASGISIDHEEGITRRVEQYRIGGFGTDAFE